MTPLQFLAKHGRLVLVAGLLAGILLPGLALAMKPWLPELIASLLFLAALRIGPREAMGKLRQFPGTVGTVLFFQTGIPLLFLGLFSLIGFSGPIALALVLMATASSIFGSANLTILTGNDPAPALRLLVIGNALLPLTVLPVFWFLPELQASGAVFSAAGRLLVIILVTTVVAFAVRHCFFSNATEGALHAIDGFSVLALAIVVIGLMSAIGPALKTEPMQVALVLAVCCAANFGLQIVTWIVSGALGWENGKAAHSIVAGNRNMGLFLTALPVSVTDPLLLFIGCYQIPMYLTPLVLGKFYKR